MTIFQQNLAIASAVEFAIAVVLIGAIIWAIRKSIIDKKRDPILKCYLKSSSEKEK